SASDPVIRAYSEHRFFVLRVRILLVLLLLFGLWIAAPRFGMMGAIVVMACISLLESAVMAVKVSQILRMRSADLGFLKEVLKIVAAAVFAGGVTLLIKSYLNTLAVISILAVSATVFSVVYLGAVLFAGILTVEEHQLVRGLPRQLQQKF